MKKIFTINCGSTSTKVAYFEDDKMVNKVSLDVTAEQLKQMPKTLQQLELRANQVKTFLKDNQLDPKDFDIIVARAGTIPAVPYDGAFEVNELMLASVTYAPEAQHASTLSCLIANELVKGLDVPVIIYDPTCVDSADPIAKITGIPEITNMPIAHLLNTKMAGITYAESIGKKYKDLNLIIVQLGGGITLGFHDHGRIADWVYDDEGPMSPQRAGRIPTRYLANLCYNSKMTLQEMRMYLCGQAGLVAYFGTQDVRDIEKLIDEGDEKAELVLHAMAYGVAKSIGELSVIRKGKVDQIVLTGGIAYSKRITGWIKELVEFIAPVSVIPGEKEMEALAAGGLRVLKGEEEIHPYNVYPKGYHSIEEIINNPNFLA
ncbi:butyrate kinase [Sinanaerobacter chloroacetimidivorans]|jgi:butyrate kinase|uniref:Probable butyrate kinase n=1 Tax=Sinanaerobacter chloroacetimidivorans TaxID=2818044 RepID=A0A8J7W1B6_9FIRM|nr:butyrate kinase [Sinanaerobacter chloroacetimidivorans]MBR0597763.1 butyrate kinase [Sinanaerobacter chloroacetimidivorans]